MLMAYNVTRFYRGVQFYALYGGVVFIGEASHRIRRENCAGDKIPDDGQKNCPKHVEFYTKN